MRGAQRDDDMMTFTDLDGAFERAVCPRS